MAKAEERLRALVHPAISAVDDLIKHADSDAVKLAAARLALGLAGFKETVQVQSEHEITVRIVHEDQPILTIEQGYTRGDNSNGQAR